MRRDFKIRKNNMKLKNLNKRAIIYISIVSFLIFMMLLSFCMILRKKAFNNQFESYYSELSANNEEESFSLNKISIISSATANTTVRNLSYLNLDISQYSDIGIYLNNPQNLNISKLYIDEINFSNYEIGMPCLYKKEINEIGICSYSDDKVLNNMDNLNLPEDATLPICIGFYNKNIKSNYVISTNDSILDIDGKILKEAGIVKSSIHTNISFNIHIITDTEEHFICNINLDIPFEDDNGKDIYESGYIVKNLNNLSNYKFLKIE